MPDVFPRSVSFGFWIVKLQGLLKTITITWPRKLTVLLCFLECSFLLISCLPPRVQPSPAAAPSYGRGRSPAATPPTSPPPWTKMGRMRRLNLSWDMLNISRHPVEYSTESPDTALATAPLDNVPKYFVTPTHSRITLQDMIMRRWISFLIFLFAAALFRRWSSLRLFWNLLYLFLLCKFYWPHFGWDHQPIILILT